MAEVREGTSIVHGFLSVDKRTVTSGIGSIIVG